MLLTTEVVDTPEMAATILRWYTYRWRVEEYHKIFKSGCQSERYRLAGSLLEPLNMKSQIGMGKNNQEIAGELYLSEGTVKNHLTQILSKMSLRDRTQAALWAQKHLS